MYRIWVSRTSESIVDNYYNQVAKNFYSTYAVEYLHVKIDFHKLFFWDEMLSSWYLPNNLDLQGKQIDKNN